MTSFGSTFPASLQEISSHAGQCHSQTTGRHPRKWSFCLKASSCVSAHLPAWSIRKWFGSHFNSTWGSICLDSLWDHPGTRFPNVISLETRRKEVGQVEKLTEGLEACRISLVKSRWSLHKMQNSGWNLCASRIPPMDKALNGFLLYQLSPQCNGGAWVSAGSENRAEGRTWSGSSSKGEREWWERADTSESYSLDMLEPMVSRQCGGNTYCPIHPQGIFLKTRQRKDGDTTVNHLGQNSKPQEAALHSSSWAALELICPLVP